VCAALLARLAWDNPRYILPLALVTALIALPPALARRRMRKLLKSGDVQRILGAWAPSFERIIHPETMRPLLVATAYATCGFVQSARRALERAVRGPAWDAAIEQRLVIETLLDTYEGEREAAVEKAAVLERLPVPPVGFLTRRKIMRLRRGVAAHARAFAHRTSEGDATSLRKAAKSSPIVYWAMRYAEAVVAVDRGDRGRAALLLDGAPEWPVDSVFQAFHAELRAHASV